MKVLSHNSLKGKRNYNHDILSIKDKFCYVMDGATPLFNDNIFYETSDLYEYMHLLKNNIEDISSIEHNIIEGIKKSNKHLKEYEKYEEYALPNFTIAAIKENEDTYESYLLCDSLISILYKDGKIENIEDNRFDSIKNQTIEEIKKINKLNLTAEEILEHKKEIWRKYRKLANKGYPVGTTNYESINKGIIKTIEKEKIDKILICTDGFYNELGKPSNNSYFEKDTIEKKISNIKNNDDLTYILIDNI